MDADEPFDPNLLAHLGGEPPARSPWLARQLAVPPRRSSFSSNGTDVELLEWGEPGRPGVLLLHGMGAHADWWSFIAPSLAQDYHVAAISLPGMGGSQWRPAYSVEEMASDVWNAVDAANLSASGHRPVLVGHSFGGRIVLTAAATGSGRLAGGILIDSLVGRRRQSTEAARSAPLPVYPSPEAALARFRFAPPQSCDNLDIVDFIARKSLRHEAGGWTWRFDPNLWRGVVIDADEKLLGKVTAPIALLYGQRSTLVSREMVVSLASRLPSCLLMAEIPEAAHHVPIDQPIALIAALRATISVMQRGEGIEAQCDT